MGTNIGMAEGTVEALAKEDAKFIRDANALAGKRDRALDRIGPVPLWGDPTYVRGRQEEEQRAYKTALAELEDAHNEAVRILRPHGLAYVEEAVKEAHKTEYKAKARRWGPISQDKLAARRPVIALECSALSPAAILAQFRMAKSVGDSEGCMLYAEHGLAAARARTAGKKVGSGASLDDFVTLGDFEKLVEGDAGAVLKATLLECQTVANALKAPATTREIFASIGGVGVDTSRLERTWRPPTKTNDTAQRRPPTDDEVGQAMLKNRRELAAAQAPTEDAD